MGRKPPTELEVFSAHLWLIFGTAVSVIGIFTMLLIECPPWSLCYASISDWPILGRLFE